MILMHKNRTGKSQKFISKLMTKYGWENLSVGTIFYNKKGNTSDFHIVLMCKTLYKFNFTKYFNFKNMVTV